LPLNPQRSAAAHPDGEAEPVVHKFLHDLARHARSEPEELVLQPFDWNEHQPGTVFDRLANQVDRIALVRDLGYGLSGRSGSQRISLRSPH
jgi:hypothetical protein